MNKEENLINHVADNITYYRKKLNLTQSELAEKLGYSDKSISKWERKEGIPSVLVLSEMAAFFNITLNDITSEIKIKKPVKKNKDLIAYFYASIAFFLSVVLFGIGLLIDINYDVWKILIYGVAASSIVLYVFAIVNMQKFWIYTYLTIFIWVIATAIFFELNLVNGYIIYVITLPLHAFSMYLMKIILLNKKK